VKKSSVFEWYKKFREGSEDVKGAERSVWECRGPIKMLKKCRTLLVQMRPNC
jgi:hypothetical protein